jgi:hypothetical protein
MNLALLGEGSDDDDDDDDASRSVFGVSTWERVKERNAGAAAMEDNGSF